MASDMLSIGTSGVLAQQRLLQTTSNNIVNINSQGYVRERTLVYSNSAGMGTGNMISERLLNTYAQTEMRLDTSAYHSSASRYGLLSHTDNLLGEEGTSVGTAVNAYFKAFHTANESAADIGARKVTLTELGTMVNRFNTLSGQLDSQTETINKRIEDDTKQVNHLLNNINELNQAIMRTQGAQGDNLSLYDQRDEAVRQLSEMMDIRTVPQDNGTVLVNMSSGHSLVLAGSVAEFKVMPGNPDSRNVELSLTLGDNQAQMDSTKLGGSLGGMFAARKDLEPAKRELGQMAIAMADAINQQNRLGMDLDNELGQDIFSLPGSQGLANASNTGNATAKVNFVPGQGSEVTPFDYEVRFTSDSEYEIFVLDKDGNRSSVTTGSTPPATVEFDGLSVELSGTPAKGDKILLQPTKHAAAGIKQEITRPEDLALASPLKADKDSNNIGNADIKLAGVFNTGPDSHFAANGLDPMAPQHVKIDKDGNYEVYAADGKTLIGIAPAATKGKDLMASLQVSLTDTTPVYKDPNTTPGYEFSVTGTVEANDSFTISYNKNGFSDNSNGLLMADLQNKDVVNKGGSTDNNKMTLNQAYANLVMGVGNSTRQAQTDLKANEAKLLQSTGIYESVAGVNLEEEAANLIRFQQSYAASAQVVNTAKSLFDTLLSSLR
ncbi:MAG: FlgK family flagellar hook-associated protein [Aeromonas sp.]